MNWTRLFEWEAFVLGFGLIMFVFVCAMYMGLKGAGVKGYKFPKNTNGYKIGVDIATDFKIKKTNKLFGERGVRKSMLRELIKKSGEKK